MRPAILRFGRPTIAAVVVLAAFNFIACESKAVKAMEVRDPCNTFTSESSPRVTPELRQGSGGLELVVSLTPAANQEARKIVDSLNGSAMDIVIHPRMERIRALRVEDGGYVVLHASSQEDASRVLKTLCFQLGEELPVVR